MSDDECQINFKTSRRNICHSSDEDEELDAFTKPIRRNKSCRLSRKPVKHIKTGTVDHKAPSPKRVSPRKLPKPVSFRIFPAINTNELVTWNTPDVARLERMSHKWTMNDWSPCTYDNLAHSIDKSQVHTFMCIYLILI